MVKLGTNDMDGLIVITQALVAAVLESMVDFQNRTGREEKKKPGKREEEGGRERNQKLA